MDPMPPINKVFSLISQEEHQRKISMPGTYSSGAMAFASKAENNRGVGNSGSHIGNSRTGNIKKKERSFCTCCNIHGHSIDKCYKLHGYPPGYKLKQREGFQNTSC